MITNFKIFENYDDDFKLGDWIEYHYKYWSYKLNKEIKVKEQGQIVDIDNEGNEFSLYVKVYDNNGDEDDFVMQVGSNRWVNPRYVIRKLTDIEVQTKKFNL